MGEALGQLTDLDMRATHTGEQLRALPVQTLLSPGKLSFMDKCSSDDQCESRKCVSSTVKHPKYGWSSDTVCKSLGYHCCVGSKPVNPKCKDHQECQTGCCDGFQLVYGPGVVCSDFSYCTDKAFWKRTA